MLKAQAGLRSGFNVEQVKVTKRVLCVQVIGQTADLVDLQRILLRSKKKLNSSQQQNMTVGSVPPPTCLLLVSISATGLEQCSHLNQVHEVYSDGVMQRLAIFEACSLLKKYEKEYKALQAAMQNGASIAKCVQTIEEA